MNLPKRVLILCEGESEQIYLKGLKKDMYFNNQLQAVEIIMYQPNDFSPLGIVKEAKKRMKEARQDKYSFNSVWVVFDKDDHKKIPEAFNLANSNNPPIEIAFSNICFEYWILLHFEKTSRFFKDSYEIIEYIEKRYSFDYSKTMNIYEKLKTRICIALKNTDWLLTQNAFDLDNNLKPYDLKSFTDFNKLYHFLNHLRN